MDNETLINGFRKNNQNVIQEVYLGYRNEFIGFAIRRFLVNTEDAKETYHEAFYIFYENIISGRLSRLTSSAKTYIFQVGKNILRNEIKRKNRKSSIGKLDNQLHSDPGDLFTVQATGQLKEIIVNAIRELGEKCYELLTLYYFHKMKYEELIEKLHYSSIDSLKTQKYKCFKKLQDSVKSKYSKDDLLTI